MLENQYRKHYPSPEEAMAMGKKYPHKKDENSKGRPSLVKTESGREHGCQHHHFQKSSFLCIQTKTQSWSFETKTRPADFSEVSVFEVPMCRSSVDAGR